MDVLEAYGDAGLGVFQGGSADVRLAMIRNNGIRGINLSNGGALLMANSTVQNNTGDGLGVFNGASALLIASAVTITSNTGAGVNLFDGASADIQFASITLNGGRGISASTGSKLRLLGSTVSQHPNDGVGAFDGASVLIQCAFAPFPTCATGSINTISQNNFNGVNVATGSTGVLQGVTVSGTTGNGVRVDTNATLRLQTASTVITGNHRRGDRDVARLDRELQLPAVVGDGQRGARGHLPRRRAVVRGREHLARHGADFGLPVFPLIFSRRGLDAPPCSRRGP